MVDLSIVMWLFTRGYLHHLNFGQIAPERRPSDVPGPQQFEAGKAMWVGPRMGVYHGKITPIYIYVYVSHHIYIYHIILIYIIYIYTHCI